VIRASYLLCLRVLPSFSLPHLQTDDKQTEKHPEFTGLVFVEGLGYSIEFESIKAHPINFGKREWNDRLVYSPHQYGPSVTGKEEKEREGASKREGGREGEKVGALKNKGRGECACH